MSSIRQLKSCAHTPPSPAPVLPLFLVLQQPDEFVCNAAIVACSNANQWERALALFRSIQQAGGDGSGRGGGNFDRSEMTGVRGHEEDAGCGRIGGLGTGPTTTGKVMPGTATYNAAITACARGLRTEEALSLLREMAEQGVPRDEVNVLVACVERL